MDILYQQNDMNNSSNDQNNFDTILKNKPVFVFSYIKSKYFVEIAG